MEGPLGLLLESPAPIREAPYRKNDLSGCPGSDDHRPGWVWAVLKTTGNDLCDRRSSKTPRGAEAPRSNITLGFGYGYVSDSPACAPSLGSCRG